jgi:hypothetical protein
MPVTVQFKALDAGRLPVAGRTVTGKLRGPDGGWLADHTGTIITDSKAISAEDGTVQLQLTPQAEIAATGTCYEIRIADTFARFYCVVPVSPSPVQLADILIDPDTLEPVSADIAPLWLTRAELGQPGGVAPLDDDGLVPPEHLPAGGGGGAVASVNGKTGAVVLDAVDVGALTQDDADELYAPIGAAIAANPVLGKTFSPADHGAVGDGVADDYLAVKAAWDAMWTWLRAFPTKQNYANFYVPADKHYRIDTSNGARLLTTDQARAILPIPMIPRTGWAKKIVRIIGGGEHYIVRTADLGSDPETLEQVDPGSVLVFDSGATVHTWSNLLGLPSAIGATDADMTDPEGNVFTNVHVTLQDITIRQNDNPSLCSANLEQVSTARGERVRFDVESVLDAAPLCTHPTGAALLLPRTNNNVAVSLDKCVFEGMYTGVPLTEHGSYHDLMALRCTIGIANRRPNSHHSLVQMLKIEQCPYGLAGYDPATTGVRTAYGWTGEIVFLDFEDYDANGTRPEIYTPIYPHQHFWDDDDLITAHVKMNRVNTASGSPNGVPPYGDSATAYVRGAGKIELWNRTGKVAVTRLSNDPAPPVEDLRLFDGVDGPGADFANGNPIVVGVEFRLTGAGEIKGLSYWRATAAMPANATGRVYKVSDQSVVAGTDVTFAAGSALGWIDALFADPIVPEVGVRYVAEVRMPNGQYTATNSYWDSGPGATGRTNGILRAENTNDTDTAGQGVFVEGAMAFATISGNGANYWVDVIITPTA